MVTLILQKKGTMVAIARRFICMFKTLLSWDEVLPHLEAQKWVLAGPQFQIYQLNGAKHPAYRVLVYTGEDVSQNVIADQLGPAIMSALSSVYASTVDQLVSICEDTRVIE